MGQYCGDGSAEYFADGDLAAAVLGFEKHQSEHSDQRDQDRQQAEQDQLTREVRLFLVLVADEFVEEIHLRPCQRVELPDRPFDKSARLAHIGQRTF